MNKRSPAKTKERKELERKVIAQIQLKCLEFLKDGEWHDGREIDTALNIPHGNSIVVMAISHLLAQGKLEHRFGMEEGAISGDPKKDSYRLKDEHPQSDEEE